MTSPGRPSQLARVAARVLASGSTAVDFVVEHHPRDPDCPTEAEATRAPWSRAAAGRSFGHLTRSDLAQIEQALGPVDYGGPPTATVLTEPDHGDTPPRGEFLYAQVRGTAIFNVTRASSVHRVRSPHVELVTDGRDGPFKGRTVLNPGFLYEDGRHLEVLLTVGPGTWQPTIGESFLTTLVVEELAAAAAETAGAPILFLQYPAAPFGPNMRTQGGVRPAVGASLRMAIALDESRPERRITFLTTVMDIARRNGLELHVGDTRYGRVRGEWLLVLAADQSAYHSALTARCGVNHMSSVSDVVPVTFVGPARRGSTMSIVRMLRQYRIGIVGVAISSLQEVAFINLLVCLPSTQCPDPDRTVDTVEQTVATLRQSCDLGNAEQHSSMVDSTDSGNALGYRGLIGRPAALDQAPAGSERRYALWILWNLPSYIGTYALFLALEQIAQESGQRPGSSPLHLRFEYARGRVLDDDMFRGRAKVSIELGDLFIPGGGVKAALGELAQYFEDQLRSMLTRKYSMERTFQPQDIGVRVEWRERWLGPWRP